MHETEEKRQQRINILAIEACKFSGYDPYHKKDGVYLYLTPEAQTRARLAAEILAGSGRESLI